MLYLVKLKPGAHYRYLDPQGKWKRTISTTDEGTFITDSDQHSVFAYIENMKIRVPYLEYLMEIDVDTAEQEKRKAERREIDRKVKRADEATDDFKLNVIEKHVPFLCSEAKLAEEYDVWRGRIVSWFHSKRLKALLDEKYKDKERVMMDFENYKGKKYAVVEIKVNDAASLVYAEEALSKAMEEHNDLGCELDCQIVFYPTFDQIFELTQIKDDLAAVEKYCKENDIYFEKD